MYVFVYVIIIDMSTIAQAPNKTWKTFSFILLFSVSLRLHFPPSILLPSFFFIYCLITPHRRKKNKCVMVSYYRFEIAISSFYVQFDINFSFIHVRFVLFFSKTQHEYMKITILTIAWKSQAALEAYNDISIRINGFKKPTYKHVHFVCLLFSIQITT